jgi:UDP-N-acetylmuramoyl-tripeptide--D-alanyl-D-alanine ligase
MTGFGADSRRIAAGQVFVALKTGKRDGHDFVPAAQAAGAAAAIVDRPVPGAALAQLVVADPLAALQEIARAHRAAFTGTVFGITGSAGKTSTKELLAALLGGEAGGVLATEGNLNNQIGVALTLCRIDPGSHRFAVIEAGISAPGEMARLAAMIQPDVALVTLVAPAHLDDLGSLETVAAEKAVLAASVRKGGMSAFPASCEAFEAFRIIPGGTRIVVEPSSDLSGRPSPKGRVAFSVSHSAAQTCVQVAFGPPPPVSVRLPRITDGMAQNAAIAVCAAVRAGIPRKEIERRLLSWSPAPLRGVWGKSDGRSLYLDCYNANPASMADALGAFRAAENGPRLYVLGSMEELGADSARYHVDLGRSLGLREGDILMAVGSHAGDIGRGARAGGAEESQVFVSSSVEELAPGIAAFSGAIFVKGSRRYQLEQAFLRREEAAHA